MWLQFGIRKVMDGDCKRCSLFVNVACDTVELYFNDYLY